MKNFLIAVAVLAAAVIGATAVLAQTARPLPAQAGGSDNVCLQIDRVDTWSIVNQRVLLVKDKAKNRFRVALNGDCARSHFYDLMVFRPIANSGLGCIRAGDRVRLTNRQGQIERCVVRDVSAYSDAQQRVDEREARDGR